jgi:hypothetical protein
MLGHTGLCSSLNTPFLPSVICVTALCSVELVNFLPGIVPYSSVLHVLHWIATLSVCPVENCSSNKSPDRQRELPLTRENFNGYILNWG